VTLSRVQYRFIALVAVVILVFGSIVVGRLLTSTDGEHLLPRAARELQNAAAEADREGRDFQEGTQGLEAGGAGGESAEALTAAQQWAEARTAPGIVAPGAYGAAFSQLSGLGTVGGSWEELTRVPYDADDPNYRDYYSNSSGGSGLVTGRITALAADDGGNVYVGGADGGVWRSTTGGGNWTPIADGLPSLSSGDLQIAADGSLWYATGEANTGGTSYVGSGVYRLADPTSGTFSPADRVGGSELESTTINAIRFSPDGTVWVATLRGIYSHSATGSFATPWNLSFAPNPSYLPGGAKEDDPNAAYKNIVNDIAIDPNNPDHIIAGVGWRSGDSYNGFYQTRDGGAHWRKVNLLGGLDKNDIGNVSFAWAANGSRLYVMNQSPMRIQSLAAIPMTYLDGIYVSKSGRLAGPWTRIATANKLASSGSALAKQFGVGYRPGIQSWYNQFLLVDPNHPRHVFAGLEEVYESKDGGEHWKTVGPYWNFYFGCWAPDAVYPPNGDPNRCPQTTHPDQHSVAVGTFEGTAYLYVGNDGGVYRRPLHGTTNRAGHATDWESLNDGTIDALQYYAVDVGNANAANPRTPAGDGVIVSGGLQDNGGSILRLGGSKMSSNFGGDGGDVLVDPNDGCNILQEYVYLSLEVTNDCANPDLTEHPNAFLSKSDATTWDVAPPDINARFIAPFVADEQNIDRWLAGGNSLWFQDNGFAIRSGSEWQKVYTFSSPVRVATAMAYSGDTAVAGWCGPCNNAGFARGVVVGTYDGTSWDWQVADLSGVPNRYVGGAAVDAAGNVYIALNGFSRRFTEGPGAGIGHIFKSTDGGQTWTSLDSTAGSNFPDVPANSIKVLADGALVVGTDLGVVYLPADGSSWMRLGDNFPVTVAIDVEVGPGDGFLYAATHGRGIWRIDISGL
jgi:hypothetical protein